MNVVDIIANECCIYHNKIANECCRYHNKMAN